MLNPAAYVQRVKITAESRTRQITEEVIKDATLNRLPNYKHKDGRIYASKPGDPYFAVSVSPLNPKFTEQIEEGILPVVEALLEKNYLPISSCEGHNDGRSFVRIVFGSEESADEFIEEFGTMPYVKLTKLYTSANIIQFWQNDKPQWRSSEYSSASLEAQDINLLYKRNYSSVVYVDIVLYEMEEGILKFFHRRKAIKDLRTNKKQRLQDITNRIKQLKIYEL